MTARRKQKPNAHGRSTGNVGGFSRVSTDIQKSPAFQSLTASAMRVLLWAINKNYQTGTKSDTVGKPIFKLTNAEAKNDYGLNSTTFTNAKNHLEEKGFLEWVTRGGLKGSNGVCSTFCLSGEWKKWTPPPKKPNVYLRRARAALKKQKAAS
jgi:hypothetical protein